MSTQMAFQVASEQ